MKWLPLLLIIPLVAGISPQIYAPDADASNYGFDFLQHVTFDEGGDALCPCFVFEPGGGDSFAAASFDLAGKQAYKVTFDVNEAENDGRTTRVAQAFSFTDAATAANNRGDGESTGVFLDSIHMELMEEGSGWKVRVYETIGGVRTVRAESTIGDEDQYTVVIVEGNFLLRDSVGNVVLEASVSNRPIYSSWFLAFAGAGIGTPRAYLADDYQIEDMEPQAPTFHNLSFPTGQIQPGQAVPVTVTVLDDWKSAGNLVNRLHYTVDGEAFTKMATANGDEVSATIPALQSGNVTFWFTSHDGELQGSSNLAEYTVGSAIQEITPSSSGGGFFDEASSYVPLIAAFIVAFIAAGLFYVGEQKTGIVAAIIAIVLGVWWLL